MTELQTKLEGMGLLEVRKKAREVGITDLSGKTKSELIRRIVTKSKPGGVDPRINPKAAKAAKEAAKTGVIIKSTRPKPVEAPEPDDVEDEFEEIASPMLTLEERILRVESALVKAGLMELADMPPLKGKMGEASQAVPVPEEWVGDDGSLNLTIEDCERMNFDTILAVRDLCQSRFEDSPAISADMRQNPRVARTLLVRFLLKYGVVKKGAQKHQKWPNVASKVLVQPEDGAPWKEGIVHSLEVDKDDGQTYYWVNTGGTELLAFLKSDLKKPE